MANVLDELLERGYIKQFTHEEETRKLLENEKVALVPGIAFEVEDSGYVRLSYCCDYNVLKEGIRRIQNFRNIL